jgi:hypothetical protein
MKFDPFLEVVDRGIILVLIRIRFVWKANHDNMARNFGTICGSHYDLQLYSPISEKFLPRFFFAKCFAFQERCAWDLYSFVDWIWVILYYDYVRVILERLLIIICFSRVCHLWKYVFFTTFCLIWMLLHYDHAPIILEELFANQPW